jgi:uncharacterized protein YodC (DUF2158 family)
MLGYARVLNQSRGDLVEKPLQAGDLVRMKSGGPVMTVSRVGETEGEVRASWHDKLGVVHSENFPIQMLQRAGRSFFGRRR